MAMNGGSPGPPVVEYAPFLTEPNIDQAQSLSPLVKGGALQWEYCMIAMGM